MPRVLLSMTMRHDASIVNRQEPWTERAVRIVGMANHVNRQQHILYSVRNDASGWAELIDQLRGFPITAIGFERHVFDHAPAQRAGNLVGHGDAPVLIEVANPSSSRQDALVG